MAYKKSNVNTCIKMVFMLLLKSCKIYCPNRKFLVGPKPKYFKRSRNYCRRSEIWLFGLLWCLTLTYRHTVLTITVCLTISVSSLEHFEDLAILVDLSWSMQGKVMAGKNDYMWFSLCLQEQLYYVCKLCHLEWNINFFVQL